MVGPTGCLVFRDANNADALVKQWHCMHLPCHRVNYGRVYEGVDWIRFLI